jgi:hypothetical protein
MLATVRRPRRHVIEGGHPQGTNWVTWAASHGTISAMVSMRLSAPAESHDTWLELSPDEALTFARDLEAAAARAVRS